VFVRPAEKMDTSERVVGHPIVGTEFECLAKPAFGLVELDGIDEELAFECVRA
jgi:hypothetical protein